MPRKNNPRYSNGYYFFDPYSAIRAGDAHAKAEAGIDRAMKKLDASRRELARLIELQKGRYQ